MSCSQLDAVTEESGLDYKGQSVHGTCNLVNSIMHMLAF
jgi:hypothetical protein